MANSPSSFPFLTSRPKWVIKISDARDPTCSLNYNLTTAAHVCSETESHLNDGRSWKYSLRLDGSTIQCPACIGVVWTRTLRTRVPLRPSGFFYITILDIINSNHHIFIIEENGKLNWFRNDDDNINYNASKSLSSRTCKELAREFTKLALILVDRRTDERTNGVDCKGLSLKGQITATTFTTSPFGL